MRNTSLILVLLMVLFGGTVLYASMNKKPLDTLVEEPVSSAPMPQTSPVVETSGLDSPDTYTDPQNLYSFSYPNDYTLDTQDPAHPRLIKRGPAQRPQSEISDGVLIVFETIELAGKSLTDVAQARVEGLSEDGVSKLSQPLSATTLNGYTGLKYETQGFGSSKNILIQKSPTSTQAVLITYMASDPQQVGYQVVVDEILKTVKLLK